MCDCQTTIKDGSSGDGDSVSTSWRSSHPSALDPAALEKAVGLVSASMVQGADLLIINKFGKHEAEGRGFRMVVAEALSNGIPVLVGVNSLNLSAFEEFAGGLAVPLAPEPNALESWAIQMTGSNLATA